MYTDEAATLIPLLTNKNVRAMLDVISNMEGTTKLGYATGFGGVELKNLDAHPKQSTDFKQTDGKVSKTDAAGRYQFRGVTWDEMAKKLGLTDFSEVSQDLAALALLKRRGVLEDVIAGRLKKAVAGLGKEFASSPNSPYSQVKRSWKDVEGYIKTAMKNQNLAEAESIKPQPVASIASALPELIANAQANAQPTEVGWANELPKQQGVFGKYLDPNMNMQPWEHDILAAGITRDADQARNSAVASLLGENYVQDEMLTPDIENSLNKIVASL